MIAKITKGSDHQGAINLVRYLLSPKPSSARKANLKGHSGKNERVLAIDSECLLQALPDESISQASTRIAGDLFEWNSLHREGRKPPKNPFIHGSISWAPTDQINSEKALEICSEVVQSVMKGVRPVFYVVHGDTTHFHIHFLAGTVSSDGLVWNPRFDFRLWESKLEVLEKRYQFARVLNRKSEAKKHPNREPLERRPSQAEYQYEERTGEESDRRVLKRLIDAALLNSKTIADFQDALIRDGIEIKLIQSKTGHVSGIGYEFKDFYFKGSSLGKKYAYGGIVKQLPPPDEQLCELGHENKMEGLATEKTLDSSKSMQSVRANILSTLSRSKKSSKRNADELISGNDLQLKSTSTPLDIS